MQLFSVAFNRKFETDVQVSGVQGRGFDRADSHLLRRRLQKLRETDNPNWKLVDDTLLVTESFYVSEFSVDFEATTEIKAKAAFDAGEAKVDGSFHAEWTGQSHVRLQGTAKVAFAVRGVRV